MTEMKNCPQHFCQSCGMPMEDEALFGTNADGSKNVDYCSYCYQKGAFTADVDMEQMIEICVPPMVEHNQGMTETMARQMMREFFPQLKRWQK